MNMRSDLHRQVNRKVSDFIVGEAGKVGSRSAFTAAAFIGATSLAGILLGSSNANADDTWLCEGNLLCHIEDVCCGCWDAELNADYDGCAQGTYDCRLDSFDPGPGLSCWGAP